MPILDLTALPWTLEGWRPFTWIPAKRGEAPPCFLPDIGPVPISFPGTVQRALREAELLPDWRAGLNSLQCEWVEHRHWVAETELAPSAPTEKVILEAEWLDYHGWILVDGEIRATFSGPMLPQRADLTPWLGDGAPHRLAIVFDIPPEEQGQFGFTSRSRLFKPRFNYSWDWCPRFVPIGVWGRLRILTGPSAEAYIATARASWDMDSGTGAVTARVSASAALAENGFCWRLRLLDGKSAVAVQEFPAGIEWLTLTALQVEPWQVNIHGEPRVYTVEITLADPSGQVYLTETRTTGFRSIRWLPCEGAPAAADPWICEVNGVPVFLQGVNWTPVRVNYPDVTREDYARLIRQYRDMGCTLFRVWGGAFLESEDFYELCDRAGILVWQEFPLSSSGIENEPPQDEDALNILEAIARSWCRRRAHHPALLLWSGGNELYTGPSSEYPPLQAPVTRNHPCIRRLAQVVSEEDPDRRFIPASPSGPVDYAREDHYGLGIHHDIHGPWGQGLEPNLEQWRQYWSADDALFRSEVGMPGAMEAEDILRWAAGECCWPPEGRYWIHTAAWWTQWGDALRALCGKAPDEESALRLYCEWTRQHQAACYAEAARACKARFPRCGGFLVWMGHDCFPCPANNSILDAEGKPKPAAAALREIFLASPDQLRVRRQDEFSPA